MEFKILTKRLDSTMKKLPSYKFSLRSVQVPLEILRFLRRSIFQTLTTNTLEFVIITSVLKHYYSLDTLLLCVLFILERKLESGSITGLSRIRRLRNLIQTPRELLTKLNVITIILFLTQEIDSLTLKLKQLSEKEEETDY